MSTAGALILKKIEKMPQVSPVTMSLLKKLSKDDFSVSEVVKLIEPDVSLTARCLQIVNSPYFGVTRKINSIRLAVNFFGRLNLLSIVLVETFKNLFTVSMRFYEEKNLSYWDHSLRTAIASRLVAEKAFTGLNSDMAFTAGLLHDVGKVVLSESLEALPAAMAAIDRQETPIEYLRLEYEYLGIDHVQVGRQLAERWKMPESFINVLRYHHEPHLAPVEFGRLCSAVYFGNLLAKYTANPEIDLKPAGEIISKLKLKQNDLKLNLDELFEKLDEEFLISKQRLSPNAN